MKRRITEETILFISVVKWVFLATIIGVIVGASTTLFVAALNWSTKACAAHKYYFLFLPIAMLISAVMVKYLAPDAQGHGTEKVIEAVHKRFGKIKAAVVPVKLFTTIITIAFGGSAGKEGPCAQIGAGLSSLFADIFKFDESDRRKLVICGISAGFAAIFGTPIAGAIFGVEVLFVGTILYDVLLPSFISGIIAYQLSFWLGIRYFYHPLAFNPVFHEDFFIKVMFAGVFFGLCSAFLIEMLKLIEGFAKKIKTSIEIKAVIGGLSLVVLTFIFSTQYLGLGLNSIESSLSGKAVPWYSFIVKTIFTGITLGFGGSGGIVTPIFFIGSSAGTLFASVFNLDTATFAAIGLVSLLAGSANTPIAASIMAMELFGIAISPYATVACIISFLITGHRSVYPSQILAMRKSPSVHVETGKEMSRVLVEAKPRKKSLTSTILRILTIFRKAK